MNNQLRLQTWAADWQAYSRLAATEPEMPAAPPSDPDADSATYTVSATDGVAAALLGKLRDSIIPHDARRAAEDGVFVVSAGGSRSVRVPIVRGQIRHLHPSLKPGWSRPVYVLVLSVDEQAQTALAVPFGPLAEPAIEFELATGISDSSLAVLCLWNVTAVPLSKLGCSWWITDAYDDVLTAANALHQALSTRQPPPESLRDRLGAPLIHPLDPRHDYLDSEAGLLSGLKDVA